MYQYMYCSYRTTRTYVQGINRNLENKEISSTSSERLERYKLSLWHCKIKMKHLRNQPSESNFKFQTNIEIISKCIINLII